MKNLLFLHLTILIISQTACNEDDGITEETFIVYQDMDGDEFGDPNESMEVTQEEAGFVTDNTDCDDENSEVNPDATEIPDNEVDENCDGSLGRTWYADTDGDGFGNAEVSQVSDTQPTGFVDNAIDCNDNNADINPDAEEIPDNEIDENCDDIIGLTWYEDTDGDGFGNAEVSEVAGTQPTGFVDNDSDCDDNNADINPDAEEIPDNEIDENCDAIIGLTWYEDADSDGFGNAEVSLIAATQPEGHVTDNTDCDDLDEDINPDADEIAGNEIDENCDGDADRTWYEDADGDGYGNEAVSQVAGSQPTGYVLDNTDCNDANGEVNPGATEVSGDNGLDNNCDGMVLVICGDGATEGGEECDDGNLDDTDGCDQTCLLVSEVCDDATDNDGDGLIDCDDPDCQGTVSCPLDSDGDGIPDEDEIPGCENAGDCDGDGIPDGAEIPGCIINPRC